jgi:hypothetical protein
MQCIAVTCCATPRLLLCLQGLHLQCHHHRLLRCPAEHRGAGHPQPQLILHLPAHVHCQPGQHTAVDRLRFREYPSLGCSCYNIYKHLWDVAVTLATKLIKTSCRLYPIPFQCSFQDAVWRV